MTIMNFGNPSEMNEIITFQPMTEPDAHRIATWKYPEPYSLYSMDGSQQCIHELLSEPYYSAYNKEQELVGFLCTGNAARVRGGYSANIYLDERYIDIGLGMRPDVTGKGHGAFFVSEGN